MNPALSYFLGGFIYSKRLFFYKAFITLYPNYNLILISFIIIGKYQNTKSLSSLNFLLLKMHRYFSHIIKNLTSPLIKPQHPQGFLKPYLKNRQNIKYCKSLWNQFNKQTLILQGVSLCRNLKEAINTQDKVLLLKVCSIPLYEKLKKQKAKLGDQGTGFRFLNIYRISEEMDQSQQRNPFQERREWIRAELTYRQLLKNGKYIDRYLWIQRKVQHDDVPLEKKWYIYDIQC